MLGILQQAKWINTLTIHKIFLLIDGFFSLTFLLLSIIFLTQIIQLSFFLYYLIFYCSQTAQHYLFIIMPKIDVIKYDSIIKRYIFVVIVVQISYFFLAFMFWTKSEIHPLYLPAIIGIIIMLHFVASLLMFVQFLHGYISRKYYLLALGGFQVQLRINQQRQQNQRRLALIQPYYNEYPLVNDHIPPKRYYQFEDIKEEVEEQRVCSICLTSKLAGLHPIYTICKHFFHRECIQDWVKINSNCPECRTQFKEITYEEFIALQMGI